MQLKKIKCAVALIFLCFASISFAAPEQIIIARHAEKLDNWNLCALGRERAEALSAQYLGVNALFPLLQKDKLAGIVTLTIHTSETAQPTALSRNLPLINYVALPSESTATQLEVELNKQNRQAVNDLLTKPAFQGKQVLMIWEHFHTASSALEARYPGQLVTLRQLFKLDQSKFADLVPKSWPNSNYNFFWIIDFYPDGTIKNFRMLQQEFTGQFANLPSNGWGAPETLPSVSQCLIN